MEKLGSFYRDNKRTLFAYLMRMTGDYYLAGDIMQESYTRFLERYDGQAPNASLLFAMARFGMHSQAVGDSVCQALQQGYSAQEMHRMQNTMTANSRHSFSENSSKNHSFDAGQHGGQGGMGGHDGDAGGGIGGGHGGGSGGP